ncbi:hypothetical protein NHX12_021321, partial [Muraenolepis orangiensis]
MENMVKCQCSLQLLPHRPGHQPLVCEWEPPPSPPPTPHHHLQHPITTSNTPSPPQTPYHHKGAIHPVGRVWSTPSPATPDGSSPNPFQHGPSPINSQTSDLFGVGNHIHQTSSPEPALLNKHRDYHSLAAVPRFSRPSMEPQTPSPGGPDTPEQRSFRDRQKYFEIDVKQTTPDKPKPRVSLVGADDLKKMREEEERRFEQRAREYLMEHDEDDDDDDDLAHMKATGKVLLDGVEYRVEPLSTTTRLPSNISGYMTTPPGFPATPPGFPATPPGYYSSSGAEVKGDSQRNSLEDGFRLDQRPNSMTGHQERLRLQSPELAAVVDQDQDLSPAERRALEAEKRAMWRAARPSGLEEDVRQYEQDLAKRLYQARVRASQGGSPGPEAPASSASSADSRLRMKSLEQDALKAQMVIAKSKEGKKRELNPRGVTSPGRLSVSSKKFDYRQFAAIPSSKPVYDIQSPDPVGELRFIDDGSNSPVNPEEADGEALEDMGLYSNKRKLRPGRHSLE